MEAADEELASCGPMTETQEVISKILQINEDSLVKDSLCQRAT